MSDDMRDDDEITLEELAAAAGVDADKMVAFELPKDVDAMFKLILQVAGAANLPVSEFAILGSRLCAIAITESNFVDRQTPIDIKLDAIRDCIESYVATFTESKLRQMGTPGVKNPRHN